MAESTNIEWADATFNPWIGCSKVHAGCANCYAEADFDKRRGRASWGPRGTRSVTSYVNWEDPIRLNRKAEREGVRLRLFCASLADVFEDWQGPMLHRGERLYYRGDINDGVIEPASVFETPHPETLADWHSLGMDDLRRRLFVLIDETPHLDWLLLTKRPENIRWMWPDEQRRENVWLVTSVSDQATADKQIPELLKCRDLSPVLGVSCEPLLGEIDLRWDWLSTDSPDSPCPACSDIACDCGALDWVIAGGESGPNARPMHPDWARSLRDQCEGAGVPFFFKQWGEWLPYESGPAPLIEGQNGESVDRHTLPDLTEHTIVNKWWWPDSLGDGIYRRVGKKAAGNLLDGVRHLEMPVGFNTEKAEVTNG